MDTEQAVETGQGDASMSLEDEELLELMNAQMSQPEGPAMLAAAAQSATELQPWPEHEELQEPTAAGHQPDGLPSQAAQNCAASAAQAETAPDEELPVQVHAPLTQLDTSAPAAASAPGATEVRAPSPSQRQFDSHSGPKLLLHIGVNRT